MRFCFCCAVLAMLSFASARADVDDAQLREIFDRAGRYIDDPDGPSGEIRYAIRLPGGDTNRVVSLMKRTVDEGVDVLAADFLVSEIGKHGTTDDLPFLYQRIGSTNHCYSAVQAIFSLEGITSNSVRTICENLPRNDSMCRWALYSWAELARRVREDCTDPAVRAMAVSNEIAYASRQNAFVEVVDQSIVRLDPSYRMSKRRLGVLRSVQALGVNEWQTNFVMRAIRELEAYPEAELPE